MSTMCSYVDTSHYIWRENREAVVDVYGDMVARPMILVEDFSRLYKELKKMMKAIFCHAGYLAQWDQQIFSMARY